LTGLVGYFFNSIREAEFILPDPPQSVKMIISL